MENCYNQETIEIVKVIPKYGAILSVFINLARTNVLSLSKNIGDLAQVSIAIRGG